MLEDHIVSKPQRLLPILYQAQIHFPFKGISVVNARSSSSLLLLVKPLSRGPIVPVSGKGVCYGEWGRVGLDVCGVEYGRRRLVKGLEGGRRG